MLQPIVNYENYKTGKQGYIKCQIIFNLTRGFIYFLGGFRDKGISNWIDIQILYR